MALNCNAFDGGRRRVLASGVAVAALAGTAALARGLRSPADANPSSGSEGVRVVGDPGSPVFPDAAGGASWTSLARHGYSTVAAWDASGELLAIRNAGATKADGSGAPEWVLLDGPAFAARGSIDRDFVAFRWWNRSPGRMLMTTREGLVDHAPLGGPERAYANSEALFASFVDLGFSNEGNLSADDALVVLVGTRRADERVCATVWSLEEDAAVVTIPLDHPRVDFATMSFSGRYVALNGELRSGLPDRTRVYDLAGEQVGDDWGPYGTPSHYDLTIDDAGDDIAVGVAKSARGRVRPGYVIARHLRSGEITVLLEGGYPTHVSCRNTARPGWCFVSYTGRPASYPRFGDELVAVRTDGSGEFRRVARFGQVDAGYDSQPQACPDARGRRAVFASNDGDARGPVQAHVVETGL